MNLLYLVLALVCFFSGTGLGVATLAVGAAFKEIGEYGEFLSKSWKYDVMTVSVLVTGAVFLIMAV